MSRGSQFILWVLGALFANAVTVSGASTSCSGRCGSAFDLSQPCQCKTDCPNYGDCCSDYSSVCGASGTDKSKCQGRCGANYDNSLLCQCNDQYQQYSNCCPDYTTYCTSGGIVPQQSVTNGEITQLATLLTSLDVNAPSRSDYRLDRQTRISFSSISGTTDSSPNKLFSYVNEGLFSKPTYATFIKLLDNYNPYYGRTESVSTAETNEEWAFIRATMTTQVMQKAWNFLKNKGYSSSLQSKFEEQLKEIWFKKYSRQGSMDSSGFEHVFVGEIKGREVSGFHNWVQYYLQEKKGRADYAGYFKYMPNMLTFKFTWLNKWKPIGGFFIGTSPEWEVTMATVCFLLRPNVECQIRTGANAIAIQTYDFKGQDSIATAYPSD